MGSDWIMDPDPIVIDFSRTVLWDHRSDFGIHGHCCQSLVRGGWLEAAPANGQYAVCAQWTVDGGQWSAAVIRRSLASCPVRAATFPCGVAVPCFPPRPVDGSSSRDGGGGRRAARTTPDCGASQGGGLQPVSAPHRLQPSWAPLPWLSAAN